MKYERVDGVGVFTEALEKANRNRKQEELLEGAFKFARRIHGLYEKQKQLGFYPADLTPREQKRIKEKPQFWSPYGIVQRTKWGLKTRSYTEVSPYAEEMCLVAQGMDAVRETARTLGVWNADVIEADLGVQAEGFRTGDFRAAREKQLALDPSLRCGTEAGMSDPYLDKEGRHFSFNGWVLPLDGGLMGYYNDLKERALQKLTGSTEHGKKVRVWAGDAVFFFGLIADKVFAGEAMPSEKDFPVKDISIFENAKKRKFEENVRGAIVKYVPSMTKSKNWEEEAMRAMSIVLIMHELGHSLSCFGKGVDLNLGDISRSIKELEAEVIGHRGFMVLPRTVMRRNLRRMAYTVSFAWAMSDIDEYHSESDPIQKLVKKPYKDAGESLVGYYDDKGGIRVNDNQTIEIGDLNELRIISDQFYYVLKDAIETERLEGGLVRKVLEIRQRPRLFLPSADTA